MNTTTTGYLITIRRPTGVTETVHVIGDRFDNKVQRCEEINATRLAGHGDVIGFTEITMTTYN